MGGVDMKEVELMELKYWDSRDYKLKFSLEVDNNKKIKGIKAYDFEENSLEDLDIILRDEGRELTEKVLEGIREKLIEKISELLKGEEVVGRGKNIEDKIKDELLYTVIGGEEIRVRRVELM